MPLPSTTPFVERGPWLRRRPCSAACPVSLSCAVRFLHESETQRKALPTGAPPPPNFLARRAILELCNFLMLASIDADAGAGAGAGAGAAVDAAKRVDLVATTQAFRSFVRGTRRSWHPHGDLIPKFSPAHCSTGTVLLLHALLTCRSVALYGYHACSCAAKCSAPTIARRNHYWDKGATPRFGEMMTRYEHHMRFYQRLERACGIRFRIARREHCDQQ